MAADPAPPTPVQGVMDVGPGCGEAVGPWVATCGRPGPYCVRRPTPKAPNRLQVLTCTRPAGHGGVFHQAADHEGLILAQWDLINSPLYPKLVISRQDPTEKGGS